MIIDFSPFEKRNNVYYLTPENLNFSKHYLTAREKENHILNDSDVLKLPYLKSNEWPLRVKSTERFLTYLKSKSSNINVLDIGCGNGWFSNKISEISNVENVVGLDVNTEELKQAARIFNTEKLRFVYANVFEINKLFKGKFDVITLNGTIQYFEDSENLFDVLESFLASKGEIHIIDSPFYKTNTIEAAKMRSVEYYKSLGVPEMAKHYFHHHEKFIQDFEVLYSKNNTILNKILRKKDSPFSWYRWTKK